MKSFWNQKFYICAVTVSFTILTGCGKEDFRWSEEGFESLSFKDRVPIFKRGKTILSLNKDSFDSFTNSQDPYVVTRIMPSQLSLEDRKKIKDLQSHQSPENEDGSYYGLFKITSEKDHALLEQAAHIHGDFSCGNIQLVSPQFLGVDPRAIALMKTQVLKQDSQTFAPIFPSDQKFDYVANLFASLEETSLKSNIESLVKLESRHHSTGTKASDKIVELVKAQGVDSAKIEIKTHTITTQPSVIVKFEGTKTDSETVIIGAHLDSITPTIATAPGADDDASGVAVALELIKVIQSKSLKFNRRIEFHFYAAEEAYLLGSQDIAAQYAKSQRKIAGMMQLDMMLYSETSEDQTIYFVKNDTSTYLNRLLKDLLQHYEIAPYKSETLSAGTSDHLSWYDLGYTVSFPFENPKKYNPKIHTTEDLLNSTTFISRAKTFAKLGMSFLSHHAGLENLNLPQESTQSKKFEPGQDINFAIRKDESGDQKYYVSVASSLDMYGVEICKGSESSTKICAQEAESLSQVGERSNRRFFRSESSISFNPQEKHVWIFKAMNQEDKTSERKSAMFSLK